MFLYNEKYVSKKERYYYSCPWIEHGIVFFQYKLAHCCHCGHQSGGHALIRNNYTGQALNWERIFQVKDIYRKFHKKGKINTACMDCPYLKEDNWDNGRYIDHLYISHWTNCNSRCIYCYEAQNPESFNNDNYNVLPYIKEMYSRGILRRESEISFGGGEPTLLKEFDNIVKFFMDNFFIRCRVHTSGIRYSPALADAINTLLAYVVVSVDSGSRETFKQIKRVDCYDKVCDNVRKYALKTIFLGRDLISTKFIIIPGINDKKSEIDSWLMTNKENGLYAVVLDIEENWYLKNRNNVPPYIIELIKYTEKRAKKSDLILQLYERIQNLLLDESVRSNKDMFKLFRGV